MREAISNTAELGAVIGGPRIVDDGIARGCARSLAEVRAGRFSQLLEGKKRRLPSPPQGARPGAQPARSERPGRN
jgi:ketol-acid reductoisomerase